jgi:hypothetical protein
LFIVSLSLFFCCPTDFTDYKFKIRNNESSTSPGNRLARARLSDQRIKPEKKGPRSQSGFNSVRAHALRVFIYFFFCLFCFVLFHPYTIVGDRPR